MKRIRRIYTIQDWMDSLHFIIYDFFSTDLLMHKQGVIYDKDIYQRKTQFRLKTLFYKIKPVIKKNDREKVLNVIKKQEEMYLEKLETACSGKEEVYIPEKAVEYITFATYFQILFKSTTKRIKEKKLNRIELDSLISVSIQLTTIMHERFRKELEDYGYIVKKEKQQIYFRK